MMEVWESEEEAKTSEHHPQTSLSIDRVSCFNCAGEMKDRKKLY